MKKLLSLLPPIIAGMAMMTFLMGSGCTKTPVDPPPVVDVCPNKEGIQTNPADCPSVPAPTGTVTVDKTNINWKETVTFTYSFQNADQGVYIGGVLVNGQSGTYTTGALSKDSVFTIVAKGKGGTTTNPSIAITVAPDPRIAFLTTGTFKDAGAMSKKLTDTNWTLWNSAFQGLVDNFSFSYQGLSGQPGNICSAIRQDGGQSISRWFFEGETGFFFAGIHYDDFVMTSSSSFKIHRFLDVAGSPGESWTLFQK